MLGEVVKAYVELLRSAPVVCENKIAVCLANDDNEGMINVSLPALAVGILDSPEATRYIGGNIQDNILITFSVITKLNNPSLTFDGDRQYNAISLAYSVRNFLEQNVETSPQFEELRKMYDFFATYKEMKAWKSKAFHKELATTVDVLTIVYYGTIFDKRQVLCRPTAEVTDAEVILQDVKIQLEDGQTTGTI